MNLQNTEPRLFLTDYASYNSGKQFKHGHWVELNQFSDAEEFSQYIADHFEKAGINDPEPMFTDFEGFPKKYYSESMSSSDIEKLFEVLPILDAIEGMSDAQLVDLHNTYCRENSIDDEIFEFDDDFFQTYFEGRPGEAARATSFGKVNWSDNYIKFNGYGNLESLNDYDVKNEIDIDVIIDDIIENPSYYSL